MVKIRLARYGKKKQPTYRLVVSDVRKDTLGTYIESLGSYNPSVNPKTIIIDAERVKYWLSVGAQPSPTVHNLLISEGVIEGKKVKASRANVKVVAEEESANKPETKAAPTSSEEIPEDKKPATKSPEETGADELKVEPKPENEEKSDKKDAKAE